MPLAAKPLCGLVLGLRGLRAPMNPRTSPCSPTPMPHS